MSAGVWGSRSLRRRPCILISAKRDMSRCGLFLLEAARLEWPTHPIVADRQVRGTFLEGSCSGSRRCGFSGGALRRRARCPCMRPETGEARHHISQRVYP